MKQRVFLALMMPFLFIKGFAQEVNSTVPSETSEEENTTYWVSPETNNERVLNPNKFRDNWFITVNAGTFLNWCDNTSDAKGKPVPAGSWFVSR